MSLPNIFTILLRVGKYLCPNSTPLPGYATYDISRWKDLGKTNSGVYAGVKMSVNYNTKIIILLFL